MEVSYIKYNGKDIPIRVSYRAIKKVNEEFPNKKIKVDKDGMEIGDLTDNEPLLFYSLQSGHYAVNGNLDMPFKHEDMEYILDECMIEFLKLVQEFTKQMEEASPKTESAVTGNRKQRRTADKGKSK